MNQIEFIARIRHLCWCCYQAGCGQVYNPQITAEQALSLENGVEYQLKHPNCTSEENHENWMAAKKEQGWIYGEVKDVEKKTHPDMVPYVDLPEVERAKDDIDILTHQTAKKIWEDL